LALKEGKTNQKKAAGIVSPPLSHKNHADDRSASEPPGAAQLNEP
jgi:hypothetical protein